tara:strand:+ start:439 stop:651 length:213 start_codon:yes stop_codon:yes gene_type:complete
VKLTSLIFLIFRSLLGFFGFGQGNCMYYPTCSYLVVDEIKKKGIFRSIPLALHRVYICNPIYRKIGKNWQ